MVFIFVKQFKLELSRDNPEFIYKDYVSLCTHLLVEVSVSFSTWQYYEEHTGFLEFYLHDKLPSELEYEVNIFYEIDYIRKINWRIS